jgi:hypothetical protein
LGISLAAPALFQGLGNLHSCFSTPPRVWESSQLLQHSFKDIITASSALLQSLRHHNCFQTPPEVWKSSHLLI